MEQPTVQPFRPTLFQVGLYRLAPGGAVDVRIQRDLLTALHGDFPTLTQVVGGVLFSDPYKGRQLIVDQARIEVADSNPDAFSTSAEFIKGILDKALASIFFKPPFRVKVDVAGTIQCMGAISATDSLNDRFGPPASWFPNSGRNSTGLRYVIESPDGMVRDYRIEPLFAQPTQFLTQASVFSAPEGYLTVEEAMQFARREADSLSETADRIVSDLVRHL